MRAKGIRDLDEALEPQAQAIRERLQPYADSVAAAMAEWRKKRGAAAGVRRDAGCDGAAC